MNGLNSRIALGWRHHLWLAVLVASSLAFTFGFACAVPFAAFGAVAAITLPRRDAFLLILGLWLLNQIVGFSVLHYPWDAMTFAWGAILGAVAVASTAAGIAASERPWHPVAVIMTTFAASFALYEGGLYLISATVMGGIENFEPAIVLRILEINAAGFAGLLAAGALIGRIMPRSLAPTRPAASAPSR